MRLMPRLEGPFLNAGSVGWEYPPKSEKPLAESMEPATLELPYQSNDDEPFDGPVVLYSS